MADTAAAEPAALQQVARLMDGYLATQLLYVAASLRLADHLADGPRDAATLAADVGADPSALYRVLRGLAAEGLLGEEPDGRFRLTAPGACLRGDVPSSLRGAIMARGELYYAGTAGLLAAVQRGGAAFEHAYGLRLFDYLAEHPGLGAAFQASMTDRSRQEAEHVVSAYDFGTASRVVDVGGGQGILLAAIMQAAPALRGVLFDRPTVVERARQRFVDAGLDRRCEVVPGDFFEAVPAGGDMYLLSRVIHDWDDAEATQILATCRAAMGPDGTLLLVESILPERAADQPSAIWMDLHMLVLARGRERTLEEYARLLDAAGFALRRAVSTGSPAGISIIEAAPTGPHA
jgi:ubiquinone/menaquinone biosynthesis C-methylase UbiE